MASIIKRSVFVLVEALALLLDDSSFTGSSTSTTSPTSKLGYGRHRILTPRVISAKINMTVLGNRALSSCSIMSLMSPFRIFLPKDHIVQLKQQLITLKEEGQLLQEDLENSKEEGQLGGISLYIAMAVQIGYAFPTHMMP
jgi:hypothetical protein